MISLLIQKKVKNTDKDTGDISFDEIKNILLIKEVVIITVDTGWNGINSYYFSASV